MPVRTFYDLIAQLTTPTFEGGPSGPGPVGMAPGQGYPAPGQGAPDTGADLWRGPGGYYWEPRRSFAPYDYQPPAPYVPPAVPYPWAAQGGPLGRYDRLDDYAAQMPSPQAQVWGVPLLSDPFRQTWLEDLQQFLEQSPHFAPPRF